MIIFLGLFLIQLIIGPYLKILFLNIMNDLSSQRTYSYTKNDIFHSFKSKSDLVDEIGKLRFEIESLKNRGLSTTTENIATSSGKNIIKAKVISKPPFSPYDFINVTTKEEDEIVIEDDVFFGEYYIGRVTNSWKGFAEIILFSTGDYKKEVILERNSLPITMEGRGSGNFYVRLPKDFNVLENDLLKDTVLDNTIAKVMKIEKEENSSFKDVYITYPFSVFQLKEVNFIREK